MAHMNSKCLERFEDAGISKGFFAAIAYATSAMTCMYELACRETAVKQPLNPDDDLKITFKTQNYLQTDFRPLPDNTKKPQTHSAATTIRGQ